MRGTVFLLMGGICMALLSACAEAPAQGTALAATKETEETGMTQGAENGKKLEEAQRIVFSYDSFNQYSLDAAVTNISGSGADLEIRKTIGPMNYTGSRKEGKLRLDAARTEALLEILGRYDLEGMSKLPKSGVSYSPSRSLYVFLSGDQRYDIGFSTKFPETLPPVEDIMYFELFNFFNDRISGEPGWEEVRSENLEDPRNNPAYSERTVEQFGNTVRLVPGTGTDHDSGQGAKIDYGDKLWWQEENFTGTWTMTDEDREDPSRTADNASLMVDAEGRVLLTLAGEEWTGQLGTTRIYLGEIPVSLQHGEETRPFTIQNLKENSYATLIVRSFPGPVPEPQFPYTLIQLSDPVRQEQEEAAWLQEEQKKIREDGSWICEECGTVNTEQFCSSCGRLRPGSRTDISARETGPGIKRREVWPADGHLPTLAEVLAKEEQHGPLQEVLWSSSRSGMRMGDYSRSSLRLYRENGEGRLAYSEMPAYQPEITTVYSAGDEVFEKLQALADRQNLAAWSFLRTDPAKQMMVYDVSFSEELDLTFDDSSAGGTAAEVRSIDRAAVKEQGGEDVWNEVCELLKSCVDPEHVLETAETPNPYASSPWTGSFGAGSAADGTWKCPMCGHEGNAGKFCSECGSKKPQ